MPFSSFNDPVDVARAHAALERAWKVCVTYCPSGANPIAERERLAHIVASYALVAANEHDLVQRSVARFRETV